MTYNRNAVLLHLSAETISLCAIANSVLGCDQFSAVL